LSGPAAHQTGRKKGHSDLMTSRPTPTSGRHVPAPARPPDQAQQKLPRGACRCRWPPYVMSQSHRGLCRPRSRVGLSTVAARGCCKRWESGKSELLQQGAGPVTDHTNIFMWGKLNLARSSIKKESRRQVAIVHITTK
jgi:hypothetical protein